MDWNKLKRFLLRCRRLHETHIIFTFVKDDPNRVHDTQCSDMRLLYHSHDNVFVCVCVCDYLLVSVQKSCTNLWSKYVVRFLHHWFLFVLSQRDRSLLHLYFPNKENRADAAVGASLLLLLLLFPHRLMTIMMAMMMLGAQWEFEQQRPGRYLSATTLLLMCVRTSRSLHFALCLGEP